MDTFTSGAVIHVSCQRFFSTKALAIVKSCVRPVAACLAVVPLTRVSATAVTLGARCSLTAWGGDRRRRVQVLEGVVSAQSEGFAIGALDLVENLASKNRGRLWCDDSDLHLPPCGVRDDDLDVTADDDALSPAPCDY